MRRIQPNILIIAVLAFGTWVAGLAQTEKKPPTAIVIGKMVALSSVAPSDSEAFMVLSVAGRIKREAEKGEGTDATVHMVWDPKKVAQRYKDDESSEERPTISRATTLTVKVKRIAQPRTGPQGVTVEWEVIEIRVHRPEKAEPELPRPVSLVSQQDGIEEVIE